MTTHSSILAGENPVGRETWWATVCGVITRQTCLSMHTQPTNPISGMITQDSETEKSRAVASGEEN